ncbi:MAG TPA: hypothetical protein VGS21_11005 [Acidimicrobiales bacterium]|nr:hypothetical protein [Acidimicrobiales bacterium]
MTDSEAGTDSETSLDAEANAEANPEEDPSSVPDEGEDDPAAPLTWRDTIGRRSGVVLGVAVTGCLISLAVAGFRPALYLLVLIVTGFVLIIGGGRIHGRS